MRETSIVLKELQMDAEYPDNPTNYIYYGTPNRKGANFPFITLGKGCEGIDRLQYNFDPKRLRACLIDASNTVISVLVQSN